MGKQKHEKQEKNTKQTHAHDNHKDHLGCVWSIFLQALKYQHWHNVKKRLPHRRHGCYKQTKGYENQANKKDSNVGNQQETSLPEVDNSKVKQKVKQANPGKMNSVKARIKALINDERSKRKGQRHSSSSNPEQSQLVGTNSIRHLEPSDEDLLTEIILEDRNPTIVTENSEISDATSSDDTRLPQYDQEKFTDKEICEDCQSMLTCKHSGHNQVENEKQLIENLMLLQKKMEDKEQTLLEQKLTSTEEVTSESDDSLYQSKAFLEALDLINTNRDFFLRVLHDPSSVVAHHLHNERGLSVKTGVTKSEPFPLPGSPHRSDPEMSKPKHEEDVIEPHEQEEGRLSDGDQAQNSNGHESLPSITHEYRVDGIQKPNQERAEITDGSSPSSSHHPKNHVRNEAVIKRFKDLKKKIQHALKESKIEKPNRITMDAFLHKIPHHQGFSTDLKKKILDQVKYTQSGGVKSPGSRCENDHAALIGKTRLNRMTRKSSLSDSLDKYRQLFESSFSGEAKQHTSERLKLRRENSALPSKTTPKSLERLFSLPEIKSYHYQSEDLPRFSTGIPVRTPVEKTVSVSGLDEQGRDIPIASEYSSSLDTPVESREEKLLEASETEPVNGDQVRSTSVVYSNEDAKVGKAVDESAPDNEQDIDPVTTKLIEPSPVSVQDSDFEGIRESTLDFPATEELMLHGDSEVELESIHPHYHDSLTSHLHESSLDTPLVAYGHATDIDEVEIPSKGSIDILHAQVDTKHKAKFDYVRNVLDLSGFSRNESLGAWHSNDQPVDPSVFEEVEGCIPLEADCDLMMLLFDLVNEVLIDIYERSYSYYPMPLSSLSHSHPMPAGHHVLKEVWENISWYLRFTPQVDQSLDYVVARDLAKGDEWMNLQFDTECVALEVEELIFEDLLGELSLDISL